MKHRAFPTIRPVVSRKQRGFSVHVWTGGACRPRGLLFSKANRSHAGPYLRQGLSCRIYSPPYSNSRDASRRSGWCARRARRQTMNAGRAQDLPTQVLHSMTRDKASRFHTFRWEKRAGEGMGGLGGRLARTPFLPSLRKDWALSRWRRPKGGPKGRAR